MARPRARAHLVLFVFVRAVLLAVCPNIETRTAPQDKPAGADVMTKAIYRTPVLLVNLRFKRRHPFLGSQVELQLANMLQCWKCGQLESEALEE